jgi:hypothetical protein
MATKKPVAAPPNPGSGRPGQTHAGDKEAIAIRDNRALELRIAGLTYQQIGDQLGCAKSKAFEAVQRAMKADHARIADIRDEYRTVVLARLETMVRAYWLPAVRGRDVEQVARDPFGNPKLDGAGNPILETVRVLDYQAADKLFRALDREVKLLGLDAPVRVAVSTETSQTIVEMLADLERMLEGAPDVIDADSFEVGEDGHETSGA